VSMNVDRAEIERARTLIAEGLGLWVDDERLNDLAAFLEERALELRSSGVTEYLQQLAHGRNGDELRAVAERMTVGETYFFRDWDQFRALTGVVLPDYARRCGVPRSLRILSAGCASGEEAFSLAILLREQLINTPAWDVTLVGIDVNPVALKRARRARYSSWALRETPKDLRERYFRPDGRELALNEEVRQKVLFEERNLVGEDARFWRPGAFDVIFCRNVTMYFTPEAARAVIARIASALSPGGYLFLGYAENLRGISNEFHLLHTHTAFYYQLRESSPEPTAPSTTWPVWEPSLLRGPAIADATSGSWVEVIRGASQRIAVLIPDSEQPPSSAAPADPLAPAEARRSAWNLSLVLELLREERFSEAITALGALPPEARVDPDVQLLHAVLLTNLGRADEAEAVCTRLLGVDELNAGAHYLMALCREHAGDPRRAFEHDEAAVYLDPDFAMPHLHMGLLARRAGDRLSARRKLAQASDLLAREDPSRILLFGGGFSRQGLMQLSLSELRACGGEP